MPNLIEKPKEPQAGRVQLPRQSADRDSRQPTSGRRGRDAGRHQFRAALPARDGRLARACRAVRRRDPRRDPARSAEESDRRPLARARRRPSARVLLWLPRRRPQGQRPSLRHPVHPARPLFAGALVRPAMGALGQPPPPQLDDRIDDRPPAGRQPAHPPGRHDHLRATRARFHDRPQLGRALSRHLFAASPRRRTISPTWESPPSSCCRSTNSTKTTASSSIR